MTNCPQSSETTWAYNLSYFPCFGHGNTEHRDDRLALSFPSPAATVHALHGPASTQRPGGSVSPAAEPGSWNNHHPDRDGSWAPPEPAQRGPREGTDGGTSWLALGAEELQARGRGILVLGVWDEPAKGRVWVLQPKTWVWVQALSPN